ncbi:hypothetical protein [Mucilaginibacter sp.]|uniref:hypothetical protein n=1 Tax=Mucilaginibacter sp. TaxID=1882438 RepID=UPI00262F6DC0|nr:hypothetical protein [Mucilaginibacter sp.]MDB5030399.1 hypothetical protein [Mucilaginibacter sp.]
MTEEQYNKSINTQELQLTVSKKLSHFSIVLFCLFVCIILPVIHAIKYFQGDQSPFMSGEILIIIIPAIIGLLFYWLQKSRLKFKIITTSLTRANLIDIINLVGKQLEWSISHPSHNEVLARTNPSFFSGSWGEQVTVLFYGDEVLINSVCDLNKQTSVVSFGRNRKNVETLINAIKKADKYYT